jgi:thioredoxin reductase (NADPH)
MNPTPFPVIIIGGGPAGLTAGLYCARALLSPVIFAGSQAGGQLLTTTTVENFPGFPEGVQGPDLMEKFRLQAERFGAVVKNEEVTRVDLSTYPFKIYTEEEEFSSYSLIIATGATPKELGVKGEKELKGRGVSTCATCDGYFFRGMDIIVVGGGDSAMEEALFLTHFARSVTVVHRRDRLRASPILQERAKKNPKIQFLWNTVVMEILGNTEVKGVIVKNVKDETIKTLDVRGVFVAIGHTPNSSLFTNQLKMDEKGYIWVKEPTTETSVPGVFACGDVVDSRYRQAVTAAGTGCKAALDVERWLQEKKIPAPSSVTL